MSMPFKKIISLDFETRYAMKSTEWSEAVYSLSKMTTEEYIRSPLFKAFGVSMHEYGTLGPRLWYTHDQLPAAFAAIDWSTTAVLCHNAAFDGAILSMIYDVRPAFILDSLSMARALRGVEVGNSLKKLAEMFQLPPKGEELALTAGLFEITPDIANRLGGYCKHDVFLCERIFNKLVTRDDTPYAPGCYDVAPMSEWKYPVKELRLIDMTIRMFTEPQLVLDVEMLQIAKDEENEKLRVALERVGVQESELASNDQFAVILERMGVMPPTKKKRPTEKTPHPVGENFAFAKNDAHFQAMLNGDNEDVALLCEARLRVKSTLERTRAQRFIDIAGRGPMPVPLYYYGAETGRWSATGGVNLQNMKRGSFLRKSIMAPEGFTIVCGDLSQIEPRVLAWQADYHNMLEIFRAGGDPYATFGSQMFNIPGLNKDEHPLLRQSSKSALLGCGYQLGWASFSAQLLVGFLGAPPKRYDKDEARQLGVTGDAVKRFIGNKWHMEKMMEIQRTCTDEELLIHCLAAKAIVEKYRNTAEQVVGFWKNIQERIVSSLIGGEEYNHKDVLLFRKEEIVLVNGMSLKYPNIEISKDERGHTEYRFGIGDKKGKLYAGRICNNVTQALARIVMSDGMLRVQKRYPVIGTVHDELLALVVEHEADEAKAWVHAQMTQVPKWMPGIPLNADVGYHRRYGLAKN